MKNKAFKKYYIFTISSLLVALSYPIYMGVKVVSEMMVKGYILSTDYPKYTIPYTPIAISVLLTVLLMPVVFKYIKKHSLLIASVFSLIVFFITEFIFESQVLVNSASSSTMTNWSFTELVNWQMASCISLPPENAVISSSTPAPLKPIDILIGDYSPTFKIHFYFISVILILTILNCLYGFGKMILSDNKKKLKPLIMQSILSGLFLMLCLLACFTAFFRTGELLVSPLSAFLMTLFFVVMGVTAGIYVGTLLIEKSTLFSIVLPAVTASITTLLMYIGEMFLLRGNLYILGTDLMFTSINGIVLSPFDIIVIIASGLITAIILMIITKRKLKST